VTSNNDRSLLESLLTRHYEWFERRMLSYEKQITELTNENKLCVDRIESLETAIVAHTKKSSNNNQKLNLLVSGIFFSFFLLILLGTTVEGSIGSSKISYSSNGFLSFLISIVSLGGGSVALAPVVKQYFKK
jgi:hypothetical protein